MSKNDPNIQQGNSEEATMIEYIRQKIKKGADIDMVEIHGEPAIHWATIRGACAVIVFLIRKNADIDIENSEGWTPLQNAIFENKIESAKCLIEQGASVNNRDQWGRTPIYSAVYYRRHEIATHLLKFGADVNAKSKYGSIALHQAIENLDADMVQILIDYGADIHARGRYGLTPTEHVSSAASTTSTALLTVLESLRYGTSPTKRAPGVIREIIQETIQAESEGCRHICDIAHVTIKSKDEQTIKKKRVSIPKESYSDAIAHSHWETVRRWVELGKEAGSSMCSAIEVDNIEMLRFLIEHGGIINKEMLTLAVKTNSIKTFRLCIESGGKASNEALKEGPLLQLAIKIKNVDAVEFMIEKGAKCPTLEWNDLYSAVKENQKEIAKCLVKLGLNPEQKDCFGTNALREAIRQGWDDETIMNILFNGSSKCFNLAMERNNTPRIIPKAPADGHIQSTTRIKSAKSKAEIEYQKRQEGLRCLQDEQTKRPVKQREELAQTKNRQDDQQHIEERRKKIEQQKEKLRQEELAREERRRVARSEWLQEQRYRDSSANTVDPWRDGNYDGTNEPWC